MEIRDSRRVPGPNLATDRSSAVLDVAFESAVAERFVSVFRRQLARMLEALEWNGETIHERRFAGGASFALTAPIDALYAATEVNEWAFAAAKAVVDGGAEPALEPGLEKLRDAIARERAQRPRWRELALEAAKRGVAFLPDDRATSIGMGAGSLSFPTNAIPSIDSIDWQNVHDVPCALVTGTNGKSTTVRLVASIARVAGKVAGVSSTDWVRVGDLQLDAGDYSGPSGARMVLRDPRVELAVLETARGGMLRRGLVLRRADAAALLNVAEDHLGEWGVDDLSTLVETKFVIARAVEKSGVLVLNADDPKLVERAAGYEGTIAWFSLDPSNELVKAHVARGGRAAIHEDRSIVLLEGANRQRIVRVDEIPITFGGAARHNIANALAAVLLARSLSLPIEAMGVGLATFSGDAADNPGRLNVFELNGVRAIVDFAHNPHGYRAFFEMVERIPANRRAVLLGQAGDRDDASIRELVRIACSVEPEYIVIKEMPAYLRGRKLGEVPAVIAAELAKLGVSARRIGRASSELEAMKDALHWAKAGDLLILLAHSERDAALELLAGLRARNWKPGEPLRT